jgi:TonB family protein
MNAFPAFDELERQQERIIRKMMVLSVAAHAAVFLLGSAISPLFPPRQASPPVFVELTDAPMPELPEEPTAPPSQVSPAAPAASAEAASHAAVPDRPAAKENPAASAEAAHRVAKENPAARRWLEKLDAGTRKFPEAPIVRKEGRAGGIPVRTWTNEGPAKPGDFAPAVAPERSAALGKHLEELEARVRLSGRPAVGSGSETEASMMFGGTGTSANEQIPPWIRDMIRKKVRGYLPELEAAYTAVLRGNPDLRGRILVRFRIDPSGKIQRAEPVEESFRDAAFVNSVLEKIRGWTFEPMGGREVEVLYPFVFVAPS